MGIVVHRWDVIGSSSMVGRLLFISVIGRLGHVHCSSDAFANYHIPNHLHQTRFRIYERMFCFLFQALVGQRRTQFCNSVETDKLESRSALPCTALTGVQDQRLIFSSCSTGETTAL